MPKAILIEFRNDVVAMARGREETQSEGTGPFAVDDTPRLPPPGRRRALGNRGAK